MTRVALVTGATQGLGLALVEGLARRMTPGDVVYLTGRDAAAVALVARGVAATRAAVIGAPLDMRNAQDGEELTARLHRDHGGLDLVISNVEQNERMAEGLEHPLAARGQTEGLVRVGMTVRRPASPRAHYVRALLRHLEVVGFEGAPRSLGYDDRGRHVLSFIEGEVPHSLPFGLSDAQLISATELIRSFHDVSALSPFRDGQEVVCHGDLGPHNTVFRGDVAVALIDWDDDVGPGRRAVDVAHAVWCFADLTEAAVPVDEQARKARLMCDGYPGLTPAIVVNELTARFQRARAQHANAGRLGGVQTFERLLDWMETNGEQIASPPR